MTCIMHLLICSFSMIEAENLMQTLIQWCSIYLRFKSDRESHSRLFPLLKTLPFIPTSPGVMRGAEDTEPEEVI